MRSTTDNSNVKAKPMLLSSNMDLDKLNSVADFKLLTPQNLEQSYTVEIKEPYPLIPSQSVSKARLHFFDQAGQTYLFGIEEYKASDYIVNREITSINLHNQTSTTRTITQDFQFNTDGELINIKGIEGRFEPWANHTPGGYLRWIQDGTFIEIDSGVLTKEEMIELAQSVTILPTFPIVK